MQGVLSYSPEDIKKYRKQHLWWDVTLGDAFDHMARVYPQKEVVVDDTRRITYGDMAGLINRIAMSFLAFGLKPGDVVVMQVPNVLEFPAIYQALQKIGVIPVMGVPRHAEKEIEHFAQITGAVAWIGPAGYRKTDYLPMLGNLKKRVPNLKHIIIVDEPGQPERPGFESYQKILGQVKSGKHGEALEKYRPDPLEVSHLLPTGGTTGLPKLVPRTHNNYLCNAYFNGAATERNSKDIDLIVTPIAHNAGLLRWASRSVWGGKLVLSNSTRPSDILERIQKERVTTTFLVPTLIIDLLHEPGFDKYDLRSLILLTGGGAYLPPEVMREVKRRIGCWCFSIFGMAEGPCIGPRVDFPEEEIFHTIGIPQCPYDEYKVLNDKEEPVTQGQDGELAGKGPIIFTGYYKAEDANRKAFTRDGFFLTGDVVRVNDRGNFMITGRKKDLINRGGEKVSAEEVEDMILTMEGVREVAAVAMPDARMGEKVCAYIKAKPGCNFDLERVTGHLKSLGASVLLLPERIEMIDDFPMTAIGKIDKKLLRERIAAKLGAESK